MKKKGLIISTVVMVVVLIASLTTATYAWFTTSDTTSIQGFNVSVTAGNVMSIGLNSNSLNGYNPTATPDMFVSGSCTYTGGDAGQFATGYWTGSTGLGATVEHDIAWSNQSKAVGFSKLADAAAATTATDSNTGLITHADWNKIIAANGERGKIDSQTARFAIANKKETADSDKSTNGDFVYMFLGAEPTTALTAGTNKLHVVIQPQGSGTTNGMAAAIHVAYKVNGATTWTDMDFSTAAKKDYGAYNSARNGNSAVINGDVTGDPTQGFNNVGTYDATKKTTTIGSAVSIDIPLTEYTDANAAAPLDQIQLVIYIAGADPDCFDSAKNGTIKIGLFFGAQSATTVGA